MSVSLPTVTIIIAAPPEQETLASLESLKRLSPFKIPVEVLVARGCMPSIQRNVAAGHARSEWLYFLDDDSMVDGQAMNSLERWCDKTEAAVVGGPNICPDSCSFIQSVFAVLLGSALTFGPSRSRYVPTGNVRLSNEKELILCNLLIRKKFFEMAGRFDESLYPNEENALMESIAHKGGKLWYDPDFFVRRYPRKTLGAFFQMLFRYGRGRAQQFRKYPSAGSLLNMAPSVFGLYLIYLLVWFLTGNGKSLSDTASQIALIPMGLYGMVLILQLILNIPRFGPLRSGPAMVLMPFCHLLYGAGFVLGLVGSMDVPNSGRATVDDVILEHWTMEHGQLMRLTP
jgi:succinoglycan biosynthesis protein ExoA